MPSQTTYIGKNLEKNKKYQVMFQLMPSKTTNIGNNLEKNKKNQTHLKIRWSISKSIFIFFNVVLIFL